MIHLFNNWVIDADDRQYISGKLKQVDGKPVLYMPKRHQTLQGALCDVFEQTKRNYIAKGDTLLTDAVARLNAMQDDFIRLVGEEIAGTDGTAARERP